MLIEEKCKHSSDWALWRLSPQSLPQLGIHRGVFLADHLVSTDRHSAIVKMPLNHSI